MNNNSTLVAIIVPVYNVEKYIDECLKSILNQTYTNIEVLMINDGSTDKSADICKKYEKKDNRFKLYNKKNGGLSDARNYGVEKSSGRYTMFVDSDDILSENIVSLLMQTINEQQSDMSVCNLAHFQDGKSPSFSNIKSTEVMSGKEALERLLYQKDISTSSCAKLYKKTKINDIAFVKGQRFEDNEFLFRVFSDTDKVAYINASLYGYRHREKSITTDIFSEKDFDIINIGSKIINESKDKEIKKAAIAYQCSNAFRIYLTASDEYLNDERFLYCKNFLDKNIISVVKDKNTRKKQKIASILYMLKMPRRLLVKIREKTNRW